VRGWLRADFLVHLSVAAQTDDSAPGDSSPARLIPPPKEARPMRTQPMMTTTHIPPGADAAFTVGQALTLYSLRARYRETRDLFTPVELARLRFLRWLVCTDRLAP
jgi:hypothetical protein